MTHAVDDLSRRCPECGAHNRSDLDPCWLCGHFATPAAEPTLEAAVPSAAPTEAGSERIESVAPLGEDVVPSAAPSGDPNVVGADGEAAVMPSFELLRYESGPPLTTGGRLILMGFVALFVLAGLGLFLPLGVKMTVVYLLVAGIPAGWVMRMIWTRQR
jgi:hypothetical protein